MSSRSIEQAVGKLLWMGFEGTHLPKELEQELRAGRCGGVTLFARNIEHDDSGFIPTQVAGLCAAIHDCIDHGRPWISIDHEGGNVQRLREPATPIPPMLHFDGLPDGDAESLAQKLGVAVGTELGVVGVDINFAPVLDVHTNPNNPIIAKRAFSTRADAAARRALAFSRGLAQVGLVPCGKHFPGHGDTDIDSHLALPILPHAMERLEDIELVPFRMAAKRQLPMIMTAHVVFEAIDPGVPATLSPKVIQGLLRGSLGFEGIVVSDDLDMKAIDGTMGAAVAAVRALEAGCDLLLLCRNRQNQRQAFEAIVRQCERKPEFLDRVHEAGARVSRVLGSSWSAPAFLGDFALLGAPKHRKLAEALQAAPLDC